MTRARARSHLFDFLQGRGGYSSRHPVRRALAALPDELAASMWCYVDGGTLDRDVEERAVDELCRLLPRMGLR